MKRITAFLAAVLMILPLCNLVRAEQPDVDTAKSAILINADTGAVLYAKNEYEKRAIASTTKIMTALLAIESGGLDRQFTVDSYAIRVEGTSMGLREGDIVTRRALLYGLMLPSGNDAANALAVSVSGSVSEFVKEMNEKARALGMNDTVFVTPSGLDADGQSCTAYDLALLTRTAMQNELFCEIVSSDAATVEFGNPIEPRTLYNSNKLLDSYDGCVGVKTGFTDNARRCLVSAAERNECKLIAVTLNAPDDWKNHADMLDYGFSLLTAYDVGYSGQLTVVSGEKSAVKIYCKEEITLGLTPEEKQRAETRVSLPPFLYAGFKAGEKIGSISLLLNGQTIAKTDIVTAEDCGEKYENLSFFEGLVQFLRKLL